MSAQPRRITQESHHEEAVAQVVQVVAPAAQPAAQPLNDRALAPVSGKIAFLRHVLVGFAKVYAENAQTLLRPVLFLWAHLAVFMKAVTHLGVPVLLALGLSTMGPVASLYLQSASIGSQWPVEVRDTTIVDGREAFQDPSAPQWIAWYARFGHPGFGSTNSIFAAHINYIHFGNGPFAYLTSAVPQDALYVSMADGSSYAYTVKSVQVVSLVELQSGAMDSFVFPSLDAHTERVTLISCGGDFVPREGGGGDYTSRIILIAERYVP